MGPLPPPDKSPSLRQAIRDLLSETRKESPDTSPFVERFRLMVLSGSDPPLESIWVHAALAYRGRGTDKGDFLEDVRAANDLLGIVSGCSASCPGLKCASLVAPVVFLGFGLVGRLLGMDLSSKRGKRAKKVAKLLVDDVLGFLSACCADVKGWAGDDGSAVVREFSDLVGFWESGTGSVEGFFPLLNRDVIGKVIVDGDCNVKYLAGAVVVEAFLLKICLSVRLEMSQRSESDSNELRNRVVCSITGLQNSYFFEILLRMLLQDSLPVGMLLGTEEQLWLKRILFDATLRAEYSFLCTDRLVHLPTEHVNSLYLTRLVVANEAIKSFKKQGDQNRAISCTNAFSYSSLPSQAVHWIASQIPAAKKANNSSGSSPSALLKWLLELEDRGFKVFDDDVLKNHARSVFYDSLENGVAAMQIKGGDNTNSDSLFYIDKKGKEKRRGYHVDGNDEEDLNQSTSAGLLPADPPSGETRSRKRRLKSRSKGEKLRKYVKHELDWGNNSKEEALSEPGEVDDPLSDGETSENE
ncbi:hypothetical protein MLD38_006226 [Melastoma candidum]|uniref:Uncharacterized protein n=1 Tax=Melastoma candidum TaxID=119954 RepID=A0ACB9RLU5_9MYRT|nr:hypothetical protein MLD38_006226 [Melastoma candidum]